MRIAWTMIALALISSGCAVDNPHAVWLHAASYHWDREHNYNEVNPGIGIEYQLSRRWSVEAGGFENSSERSSNYIWLGFEVYDGDIRVKAFNGSADNYDEREFEDGRGKPILGTTMEYDWFRMTTIPGLFGFSGKALEFGDVGE